ncbi:MAG: hypothetical protein LBU83_12620 [Bacteroidales bacterium]|jgi:hypothetical protein|nr:hypothetical protein [Bacteroidales bacterium]
MITKKKNITKKLLLLLFALSSFAVMAQRAPAEISVSAAGGISTYCFQPLPKKSSSLGYTTDFGVGFTGFFSQQLGVHVGVDFGLFNVKSTVPNIYSYTPGLYDENDSLCNLHSYLNGYAEIHKSLFLNIPVMFIFQTKQKQSWSWKQDQKAAFYAMCGVKVLFLFDNKYEASVKTLRNEAYYPGMDNWATTQLFAGYGNFKGYANKGKMEFGVVAMLAVEMGVKWRIENNMCIYTGAFFDCGLNDPIKDSRQSSGNYTDPESLKDLSILKVANKNYLMAVGIKLRLAFSKRLRPY